MSIKIDDISDIIAERLNISKYTVREINRSQWKYLLDKIQEGKVDAVKIIYIGKFAKRNLNGNKRNI